MDSGTWLLRGFPRDVHRESGDSFSGDFWTHRRSSHGYSSSGQHSSRACGSGRRTGCRSGSRWVQRKLDASRRWRDSYWRIRHLYERWGWLTIIGCRMVGYVRPWSSITAGLMRMRFLPFLAATVIGASVWTLINWMIVYHGIHLFARAQWFRWVVLGLLIVALGGIAAFWWCWGRSRPSRKSNVSKHQEPNPAEND